MKKNIIKVSVFAILIVLSILGIKNLISIEIYKTSLEYKGKLANNDVKYIAIPDEYKKYKDKILNHSFETEYLNRCFIPYCDWDKNCVYQIYCTERKAQFTYKQGKYLSANTGKIVEEGGPINELVSPVKYTPNPNKVLGLNEYEAYIFSKNESTSNYDYTRNYTSSEYNVVSKEVREWYVKQNAYWRCKNNETDSKHDGTYTTQGIKVNGQKWNTGKNTITNEIDKLSQEAYDYKIYRDSMGETGFNSSWISTNVEKKYENGKTILGPYKMSYFSTDFNDYSFSGISSMRINVTDGKNNSAGYVDIEDIIIKRNDKKQSKQPNYFKPDSTEHISRQTDLWFPKSKENFWVVINGTNYNNVYLQLHVEFEYMEASGCKIEFEGGNKSGKVQRICSAFAERSVKKKILETKNGSYTVDIKKVSSANGKTENTEFYVRKYNYNSKKYDDYKTKKADASGKIKNIISETLSYGSLEQDFYAILETNAPDGHIKYSKHIYVTVTKKITEDGTCTVDKIIVKTNNKTLKNGEKSKPVSYSTNENSGKITLTVENTKIDNGSYNINLKKVEENNGKYRWSFIRRKVQHTKTKNEQ